MTGRERIRKALSHEDGPVAVDFSGTATTGIHISVVEALRRHYGLEEKPVKVWDPYQMLGEVDDDLAAILHVDTIQVGARTTMFGFENRDWKEWRTPWGQEVLVPHGFQVDERDDGSLVVYPQGDRTAPPSGHMPEGGFYFDSIIRQEPIDEDKLQVEDNLREFGEVTDDDLTYFREASISVDRRRASGDDRAAIFTFGGTALGDISMVPAPFEPYPKGIRDVTEWYVSTVARTDFVREIFDKQSLMAVENLKRYREVTGDTPDVVFVCGTDFGTQTSQFCSVETFEDLWAPYYRRINGWIHENTNWKTLKHCCGAIVPLMESLIDSGFDIVNPVQITAAGMDPEILKRVYGERVTFWGGGVDTQRTLPFGTPQEVRNNVRQNIETFAGGGFVFNTIHNIQAKTPVENVAAMIEVVGEYR
jgi:uroporphyrinogen decarboxylase-like protein